MEREEVESSVNRRIFDDSVLKDVIDPEIAIQYIERAVQRGEIVSPVYKEQLKEFHTRKALKTKPARARREPDGDLSDLIVRALGNGKFYEAERLTRRLSDPKEALLKRLEVQKLWVKMNPKVYLSLATTCDELNKIDSSGGYGVLASEYREAGRQAEDIKVTRRKKRTLDYVAK